MFCYTIEALFSLMCFIPEVDFYFVIGGIFKYLIVLVYKYTINIFLNKSIALFGPIILISPYFLL